jgi:hypothetical protein
MFTDVSDEYLASVFREKCNLKVEESVEDIGGNLVRVPVTV